MHGCIDEEKLGKKMVIIMSTGGEEKVIEMNY